MYPPFDPHPLVRHAYAMTSVTALPRPVPGRLRRSQERFLVRVNPETRVLVHLDRPAQPPRAALLVVHGLSASSEAGYVLGTADKARAAGLLAARLNVRNCGDTEELTTETYNGGLTEEVAAAAEDLVEREGVERVHLAGFSLGGNHVLKLATEWGNRAPAWAATVGAISPCVDFALTVEKMNEGRYQRLAQRRLLASLQRILRRRHALHPETLSLEGLAEVRSIRAFDERFTAPLSGYRDAAEYYEAASCLPELGRIRVPTLIVTAQDDPLIPFESFAHPAIRENASIEVLAPERGGHVAFYGRVPAQSPAWKDTDRFWAENRLVQFAAQYESR